MLVRLELSSVRIFCTQFAVLYRRIIYQCGEYSLFCVLDISFDLILEQESIPVRYELPACQPYVLHNEQVRSRLNVSWRWVGAGAWRKIPVQWCPMSWGWGEGGRGPCTMRSHIRGYLYSEVHVDGSLYGEAQCIVGNSNIGPPLVDTMTDSHDDWKHYLPVTSLTGGNNATK